MTNRIDLTGKIFGRLSVLRMAGKNKHGSLLWECRCHCGATKIVNGMDLRNGDTVSCGCWRNEHMEAARRDLHKRITKHHKSRTREHVIWRMIKYRCYNENATGYEEYGGRGIKMCRRWRDSFVSFLEDMGEAPSPKHTIDRIDNNGHYMPSNCRWATRREQANNRRNNYVIFYKGKEMTIKQWSRELNIKPGLLYDRIGRRGWTVERAMTTPPRKFKG